MKVLGSLHLSRKKEKKTRMIIKREENISNWEVITCEVVLKGCIGFNQTEAEGIQ